MFGTIASFASSNNSYADASQQSGPVGFAGAGGISTADKVNAMGLSDRRAADEPVAASAQRITTVVQRSASWSPAGAQGGAAVEGPAGRASFG
eukprot:CAMPEP_0172012148 /NCGR_PEP_ID=MMETSP1041-20130122/8682_1 /TAXON_ID=464988 /ORGANISM="Hemiselmis andersenii, Strain CCMP439" /LENGTH=92 /DNA_ID=CAMNT_0012666703 /DNA_START=155 /DNA_END=431 /DNA_ORIENTATION=+